MNIDEVAEHYATGKHLEVNQKYGKHPYTKHLRDVAMQVEKFGYLLPPMDLPFVVAAAWCHDLIEDVHSVTYNDIKAKLGEPLANITYACTESTGRNRAERHDEAYYARIKSHKYAAFVKCADWIANVSESIRANSSMLTKYRQEYLKFRGHLYDPTYHDMWKKLDTLLLDVENVKESTVTE